MIFENNINTSRTSYFETKVVAEALKYTHKHVSAVSAVMNAAAAVKTAFSSSMPSNTSLFSFAVEDAVIISFLFLY